MAERELEGRIAVVTGATGGIGRAISTLLADHGCSVVVSDLDEDSLHGLAEALRREHGVTATPVRCDITQATDSARLADTVLAGHGRVDILCNAAGVDSVYPIVELPEAEWDRVVDVNLKGVFLTCRALAPAMCRQRYGKIVNVASVGGVAAAPLEGHYSAAKFGVVGLTQALAMELAFYNVNVNAVCPGATYTPMLEALIRRFDPSLSPESYYRDVICRQRHYFQRPIEPRDVAEAVTWLCTDRSRNVTGQSLLVTQMTELRRPDPGKFFELEQE